MKTRIFLFVLPILAAASAAHATVTYSGVQNIPIPITPPAVGLAGVYLRISDGTTASTLPSDWNTAPWINPFFGGVDIANSDLLRPIKTGSSQIVNLGYGTVIDSTGNFVAGESGSSTHVGAAADQFQLGTPGLLGFTFKNTVGGADYYGWIRVTVNNTGTGSIVDWAYEDAAGAAIHAGFNVPEASSTALVGLALCGIGIFRRRR